MFDKEELLKLQGQSGLRSKLFSYTTCRNGWCCRLMPAVHLMYLPNLSILRKQLLKQDEEGITVAIEVIVNFELVWEIPGFEECMKVLSPRLLPCRIKGRIEKNLQQYYK